MKRITWHTQVICAVLSPLPGLASTAAVAGEPRTPMPTAPTLYYACMSAAGNNPSNSAEYDSAAFARKNPGPVYKDHYDLAVKMTAAFDEYLTQKYGFRGVVNCGNHNTLAEAQQWLQGRESQARLRNFKYVATDWAYDAGPIESAPSVTTTTPERDGSCRSNPRHRQRANQLHSLLAPACRRASSMTAPCSRQETTPSLLEECTPRSWCT